MPNDETWGLVKRGLDNGLRAAQSRCCPEAAAEIDTALAALGTLREATSSSAMAVEIGDLRGQVQSLCAKAVEDQAQAGARIAALTADIEIRKEAHRKQGEYAASLLRERDGALRTIKANCGAATIGLQAQARVAQLEGALREIASTYSGWTGDIGQIVSAALSPALAEPLKPKRVICRQPDTVCASCESSADDGGCVDPWRTYPYATSEPTGTNDDLISRAMVEETCAEKRREQFMALRAEVIAATEHAARYLPSPGRHNLNMPVHTEWLQRLVAIHGKLTANPVVAQSARTAKTGWHVGTHCPRNIWCGEEMVGMCHTEQQAAEIVARMRLAPKDAGEAFRRGIDFATNVMRSGSPVPTVAKTATVDPTWGELNRERGVLIDQSILHVLTPAQRARLDRLQALADAWLDVVAPRDCAALDEMEARLGLTPDAAGERPREGSTKCTPSAIEGEPDDTAILDWLEKEGFATYENGRGGSAPHVFAWKHPDGGWGWTAGSISSGFTNAREAIRAAMKAKAPESP